MAPPVRRERSGWRDEALSRRHRLWGWDAPMVDLDLFLEYDDAKPAGIIEYKHVNAPPLLVNHPTIRAIRGLADAAAVPFLAVRYSGEPDFEWFACLGLNDKARAGLRERRIPEKKPISEEAFVTFLYWLRGRGMPPGLFINGKPNPDDKARPISLTELKRRYDEDDEQF
jgi:hypothetical protein